MNYPEFEAYYDQYKQKIYSYLYYRSGRNKQMAEDLTSEVFMKALEKFDSYKRESSFQSWIYAIAHNHLIDHFRKNKTTVDLEHVENILESDGDARSSLTKRVASEEVQELLSYLSEDEREIVLLRYQQELPMQEIADIVGMPDTTVRVVIHRAFSKLRKRYSVIYASFILFAYSLSFFV